MFAHSEDFYWAQQGRPPANTHRVSCPAAMQMMVIITVLIGSEPGFWQWLAAAWARWLTAAFKRLFLRRCNRQRYRYTLRFGCCRTPFWIEGDQARLIRRAVVV